MDPMITVVAFSATLLAAVLLSAVANRSVLSTAVVFLVEGPRCMGCCVTRALVPPGVLALTGGHR